MTNRFAAVSNRFERITMCVKSVRFTRFGEIILDYKLLIAAVTYVDLDEIMMKQTARNWDCH